MFEFPEKDEFVSLVDNASRIVIIQADNPDADSLGSALALEDMLAARGKQPLLFCGVDTPSYLHYIHGWDRVEKDFPRDFDLSIIVDTSTPELLGKIKQNGLDRQIARKGCIILDHHEVTDTISYASLVINRPAVATAELIYEIASMLGWSLSLPEAEYIVISILADSLGLMSPMTSQRSIAIVAELVGQGVSLAKLDSERRDLMRKSPLLTHYKGELLQRIEYHDEDRIAIIEIPWTEIERYSPLYNPPMLVLDEMRQTENTKLAIAFKLYSDNTLTAKIRSNNDAPIAAQLAEHFGGGGHAYASGFKKSQVTDVAALKAECLATARQLLDELTQRSLEQ